MLQRKQTREMEDRKQGCEKGVWTPYKGGGRKDVSRGFGTGPLFDHRALPLNQLPDLLDRP